MVFFFLKGHRPRFGWGTEANINFWDRFPEGAGIAFRIQKTRGQRGPRGLGSDSKDAGTIFASDIWDVQQGMAVLELTLQKPKQAKTLDFGPSGWLQIGLTTWPRFLGISGGSRGCFA